MSYGEGINPGIEVPRQALELGQTVVAQLQVGEIRQRSARSPRQVGDVLLQVAGEVTYMGEGERDGIIDITPPVADPTARPVPFRLVGGHPHIAQGTRFDTVLRFFAPEV